MPFDEQAFMIFKHTSQTSKWVFPFTLLEGEECPSGRHPMVWRSANGKQRFLPLNTHPAFPPSVSNSFPLHAVKISPANYSFLQKVLVDASLPPWLWLTECAPNNSASSLFWFALALSNLSIHILKRTCNSNRHSTTNNSGHTTSSSTNLQQQCTS
jgi:hypothetical protein